MKAKPERVKVGSVSLPFWQHKEGWRWAWKDSSGKWCYGTRRSKDTAKEAARDKARELHNGSVDFATLGPQTVELIRQFLALNPKTVDLDLIRASRTASRITLSEVVTKWSSSKLAECHGTETPYLRTERLWLEKAAKALSGPMAALTTERLRKYVEVAHTNPKSRKEARARLCAVWKFARLHGLTDSTEADKLPIYRQPVRGSVEVWTAPEMRKLLKACPESYLPWLVFSAFSGCRSEEIAPKGETKPGLEWRHVGRDYIEVPATIAKTRKRRLVPITDTLRAWLKHFGKRSGPICSTLPSGGMTGILGRSVGGWRKNALRHSYGSYRAAVLKDLPALALEMGNSVPVIERHYREAVTEEAAKAWWDLKPSEACRKSSVTR